MIFSLIVRFVARMLDCHTWLDDPIRPSQQSRQWFFSPCHPALSGARLLSDPVVFVPSLRLDRADHAVTARERLDD